MASTRLKKKEVPFEGETFEVRQWTGTERAEFLRRVKDNPNTATQYIVHRCTINAEGKPLWAKESEVGDEPTTLTDLLFEEVSALSGSPIKKDELNKGDLSSSEEAGVKH